MRVSQMSLFLPHKNSYRLQSGAKSHHLKLFAQCFLTLLLCAGGARKLIPCKAQFFPLERQSPSPENLDTVLWV